MCRIKPFIILAVAALYLSIMPWSIGTYQLVLYSVLHQMDLKQCGLIPVCGEAVGEFCTIVSLNTMDGQREGFHQMLQKPGGGISVVLFKSLHKTPA